jgi:hypothetical protein
MVYGHRSFHIFMSNHFRQKNFSIQVAKFSKLNLAVIGVVLAVDSWLLFTIARCKLQFNPSE